MLQSLDDRDGEMAAQDYNVLRRAHLPLTPPTPLLPVLTMSAGEYEVSGG